MQISLLRIGDNGNNDMSVKTLRTDDGFVFRDLNKNGRLDPYEDTRCPIEERVEDLLAQMTLEEKAGMLFHTMIAMNEDGSLAEAEVAILRLQAPFEPRDRLPLEAFFHTGDLSFKDEEQKRILTIMRQVPTIVDIYLDRPAVIPEIAAESAVLLANFGASDAAVLDVIFGRFSPSGKLPFELPSSMEAVRRQKSNVPYDSEKPLFPFGYGLTY